MCGIFHALIMAAHELHAKMIHLEHDVTDLAPVLQQIYGEQKYWHNLVKINFPYILKSRSFTISWFCIYAIDAKMVDNFYIDTDCNFWFYFVTKTTGVKYAKEKKYNK